MISSSRPILRIYNSDDHEITWLFINLILLLLPFQFSPNATAQTIPDSPESYSFGPTISRNMTIVLVILVCFFIVLGSLSVYTRHCTENRFRGAIGISVPNANSRRADGIGLDATIINSFPTFVYSTVKALKIGKNSLECAVCLNEFVDDDRLRLLPKCNHVFHSDCIDTWLASHSTCPVCRANLFPKPGDLAFTLLRNSDRDSAEESEPDRGSEMIQPAENYDRQERNTEALDVNLINPIPGTNQNRPPRSRSTGWRFGGKFPRSHSTGHSLVQPGESYDRFTLRLPDEVRREILNSSLNRARSCVAFPRVQSSRQGYRGARGGSGRGWGSFMAESGSNRWTSLLSTPFFGRNGSSRTQKEVACLEEDAGERLFVRLRADGNSQV